MKAPHASLVTAYKTVCYVERVGYLEKKGNAIAWYSGADLNRTGSFHLASAGMGHPPLSRCVGTTWVW